MITCSCNDKPCDGICREQNLKRATSPLRRCSAAEGFDVPEPTKSRSRVFGDRLNIRRT